MAESSIPHRSGSGSGGSDFPQTPEDFEADPRVAFSTVDRKWILENSEDGSEWEFDERLKRWVPLV